MTTPGLYLKTATGVVHVESIPGPGVPPGGTAGQVLAKVDADDFDTEWADAPGGAVDSVNGNTGTVVLDAADVGADPSGSAAAAQAAAVQRTNHTGTQSADTLTDGTTNKAFLATERTKLSGVATGATANDTDANLKARANHTGTQSADTLTDGTTNKAFLATERTKLSGIATSATANDTDANLKARANHTGTQTLSTISDAGTAAAVNTGTTSGTVPLLGTGGVLAVARLATGTPDGTKFVRDDGTLAVPAGASNLVRARQTTGQSVNNATFTALNGFTVDENIGSDMATNGEFTASSAGAYQVNVVVWWTANATGDRWIRLTKNGSTIDGCAVNTRAIATASTATGVHLSKIVRLAASDVLRVEVYQDKGSALSTLTGAAPYTSSIEIVKVST